MKNCNLACVPSQQTFYKIRAYLPNFAKTFIFAHLFWSWVKKKICLLLSFSPFILCLCDNSGIPELKMSDNICRRSTWLAEAFDYCLERQRLWIQKFKLHFFRKKIRNEISFQVWSWVSGSSGEGARIFQSFFTMQITKFKLWKRLTLKHPRVHIKIQKFGQLAAILRKCFKCKSLLCQRRLRFKLCIADSLRFNSILDQLFLKSWLASLTALQYFKSKW